MSKRQVTERGAMMTAPNVLAMLNGRKSQTRRTHGLKLINEAPVDWTFEVAVMSDDGRTRWVFRHRDGRLSSIKCPWGEVGHRLYIKETWAPEKDYKFLDPGIGALYHGVFYRADHPGSLTDDAGKEVKWKPAMLMPRWASRITLEIVKVRVERLRDISHEDALAEGIVSLPLQSESDPSGWYQSAPGENHAPTARWSYFKLWDSINGKGAAASNPWVFVYDFKVLAPSTPERAGGKS